MLVRKGWFRALFQALPKKLFKNPSSIRNQLNHREL